MEILKSDLEVANKDFLKSKNTAYKNYIERNKKANVGQIVTDGTTIVRISKITVGYNGIDLWYTGRSLTKKLVETKRTEVLTVFGSSENFKVVKE